MKSNDDMIYLKRYIMEALERSNEKMESYSKKTYVNIETYSTISMKEWMTSQGKLRKC